MNNYYLTNLDLIEQYLAFICWTITLSFNFVHGTLTIIYFTDVRFRYFINIVLLIIFLQMTIYNYNSILKVFLICLVSKFLLFLVRRLRNYLLFILFIHFYQRFKGSAEKRSLTVKLSKTIFVRVTFINVHI